MTNLTRKLAQIETDTSEARKTAAYVRRRTTVTLAAELRSAGFRVRAKRDVVLFFKPHRHWAVTAMRRLDGWNRVTIDDDAIVWTGKAKRGGSYRSLAQCLEGIATEFAETNDESIRLAVISVLAVVLGSIGMLLLVTFAAALMISMFGLRFGIVATTLQIAVFAAVFFLYISRNGD